MTDVAIIGLGGIGSHLCRFIAENRLLKDIEGLRNAEFTTIDNDTVEIKNLKYTIYTPNDLEKKKTEAIAELYGLEYMNQKVDKGNFKKILEKFELIVLCVDNSETRKLLLELKKPIIDIRAKGSAVAIYQMANGGYTQEEMDKFINTLADDNKGESCQYGIDLSSNNVQFGMLISASIGFQFLISLLRDIENERVLKNKSFVHVF